MCPCTCMFLSENHLGLHRRCRQFCWKFCLSCSVARSIQNQHLELAYVCLQLLAKLARICIVYTVSLICDLFACMNIVFFVLLLFVRLSSFLAPKFLSNSQLLRSHNRLVILILFNSLTLMPFVQAHFHCYLWGSIQIVT